MAPIEPPVFSCLTVMEGFELLVTAPLLCPHHSHRSIHFDSVRECAHTVPMPEKKLFKLWAERKQLARFKALAKRKKLSVAWLMRQAFDEFLKKQKG